MIDFFILEGNNKRNCTATDSQKAAQILQLMFKTSKGYVVENDKITFAQNMTVEEARIQHGLVPEVVAPILAMEVLPIKATVVKPKKKVKAKKTVVKSKAVVKKKTVKKTVVKSKPKTKAKKVAPKKKAKKK